MTSINRIVICSTLGLALLAGATGCRLGGSRAKDVRRVDGMALRKGNGEIVIFYANETPPSQVISPIYGKIRTAIGRAHESANLSEIEKRTLSRIEKSYADDLARFSAQIEKDVTGLESQLCGDKNLVRNTGLFIFTNQLAKAGKARYCLPAHENGRIEEIDFKISQAGSQSQDFRYGEMPLGTIYSLVAALDLVKNTAKSKAAGARDMAYVLISKSHGGGDVVVGPKLAYRADLMSEQELVDRYIKIASTVSIGEQRLVDLVLPDGRRLGSVQGTNGMPLENLEIPGRDEKSPRLKLGELKIGELNFGENPSVSLADLKIGELKIGELKIGELKIGELKIGELKIGELKIGELKIGELKSNDLKIGELKTGELKVGDLKVGELKNDLSADAAPQAAPGIKKWEMVQAIKDSVLTFPLVFFESCDSDLGFDLTYDLLYGDFTWNGMSGVGSVYFSDRRGLQYETVNYGSMPISRYFSDSLKQQLDLKQSAQ